jgi:hypothetical protein
LLISNQTPKTLENLKQRLGPWPTRAPAPVATALVPAPECDASHNTSPRLRKQLVFELEIGVVTAELVELLLSSVLLWQATPLDADVPHPTTLLACSADSGSGRMRPSGRGDSVAGAAGGSPQCGLSSPTWKTSLRAPARS